MLNEERFIDELKFRCSVHNVGGADGLANVHAGVFRIETVMIERTANLQSRQPVWLGKKPGCDLIAIVLMDLPGVRRIDKWPDGAGASVFKVVVQPSAPEGMLPVRETPTA